MHSHFTETAVPVVLFISLNPCSNGRCTRTAINFTPREKKRIVLILVLMEDALARKRNLDCLKMILVLILVLMEDALAPVSF